MMFMWLRQHPLNLRPANTGVGKPKEWFLPFLTDLPAPCSIEIGEIHERSP